MNSSKVPRVTCKICNKEMFFYSYTNHLKCNTHLAREALIEKQGKQEKEIKGNSKNIKVVSNKVFKDIEYNELIDCFEIKLIF